ncbi:MAG TPA: DUF3568 family protein [Candidatus Margulisiibacteriota bacterium]|nr:DUF3568 family protein [Candidatus Margulisiibacteriota bacterium]
MKRILYPLLAFFLILTISGCWFIVGGAAGAAVAYAASKDTIQGETDKDYDLLWNAAVKVCRIRGKVQSENYSKGEIELGADSSKVWVQLIRITQATVRLKVSARQYHFPNMNLAQELFTKIMDEAK